MTVVQHRRYLRGDWIEGPSTFYWTTMDLTGALLGWGAFFELAKEVAAESGGVVAVRSVTMNSWRVNDIDAWHDRVREADARRRLVGAAA